MTPSLTYSRSDIQLLDPIDSLRQLRLDLDRRGDVYAYLFRIDPTFFAEIFSPHLSHSKIYALVDHRQRALVAELAGQHPRLHAASWAANRTMHDKTLILHGAGLVYLTTANLTRGSWTLSLNRVARVESVPFADELMTRFLQTRAHARPILPHRKSLT